MSQLVQDLQMPVQGCLRSIILQAAWQTLVACFTYFVAAKH